MRQCYALHALIALAVFSNAIRSQTNYWSEGIKKTGTKNFGGGKLGTPVGDAYVAFALPAL
jgi:hypothetical protein